MPPKGKNGERGKKKKGKNRGWIEEGKKGRNVRRGEEEKKEALVILSGCAGCITGAGQGKAGQKGRGRAGGGGGEGVVVWGRGRGKKVEDGTE